MHICANAMVWLTSIQHAPSPLRYHAEFDRSALQGLGMKVKVNLSAK